MAKRLGWKVIRGCGAVNKAFLLEYQMAVLFALQRQEILDPIQLEECVKKLKKQCL